MKKCNRVKTIEDKEVIELYNKTNNASIMELNLLAYDSMTREELEKIAKEVYEELCSLDTEVMRSQLKKFDSFVRMFTKERVVEQVINSDKADLVHIIKQYIDTEGACAAYDSMSRDELEIIVARELMDFIDRRYIAEISEGMECIINTSKSIIDVYCTSKDALSI